MVTGTDTAMERFDKFRSAPDTAIEPSRRGSTVLIAPASTALPLSRNQPAVPEATPTKLQVPDFDTAPPEAAANVRPLVATPGVKAPEARVTVPSSVPVTAASAVAGCVPE